jgi:UDP-N-acetylmuramate dehydrogenase
MVWETDVALSALTRYRIGGPAARFASVDTRPELTEALRSLEGATCRVLGWGANVLVADRGMEEPLITLSGEFDFLRLADDSVEAGAAAGLPALVGEVRREGRTGWEFLEAVPGSVGGGLRMNAGSSEVGLWDRAIWVDAMTPAGDMVRLGREDAQPTYRATRVPADWVFIAARFTAAAGDPAEVNAKHSERRRRKIETQVYELPSCGSIWKNPGPPHGSAWELVEQAGMRGAIRGGAQITERHANFIANLGGAAAADVLSLMAETRRRVHEAVGVWLEPEICLWGFEREELASVGAAR